MRHNALEQELRAKLQLAHVALRACEIALTPGPVAEGSSQAPLGDAIQGVFVHTLANGAADVGWHTGRFKSWKASGG